MAFEPAAPLDALWDGELLAVSVAGRRVLLVRSGGGVFAYEDRCAHLGLSLGDAELEDGVLTCRAHRYQYDAATGAGVNPRGVCLVRYPVRVAAGVIEVDVDARPEASP